MDHLRPSKDFKPVSNMCYGFGFGPFESGLLRDFFIIVPCTLIPSDVDSGFSSAPAAPLDRGGAARTVNGLSRRPTARLPPQEGVVLSALGHAHLLHHRAPGATAPLVVLSGAQPARPIRVLPAAGLHALPPVRPRGRRRRGGRLPGRDGRAAPAARAGRLPRRGRWDPAGPPAGRPPGGPGAAP